MRLPSAFFNQSEVKHESVQMPTLILKNENPLKFFLIIGYFLIMYIFFLLFSHQSQGYVVDIYSELPLIFFISLIFCFVIGCATLFFSQGITRKLGILLLIFTYSAVLIIPYLLGYYSMGRADDMTYIGEYLQIQNSGYFAEWDIYPASHIIGAALSITTGLEPHLVSFIIPFVFSFLFVGGLYLCCSLFFKDNFFITNIAIATSFIFYLGPYNFLNVPHALFFAVMPLFLFILFKIIKSESVTIVLILPFIILIPFTHPFIVFFAIVILTTLVFFNEILKKFENFNYTKVFIPLVILIVEFLLWVIYSYGFSKQLTVGFRLYSQKITEPVFFETTEKIARINIDYFKIFKLLTLYYGRFVIPFLIIVVALVIIYLHRNRISQSLKNYMVLGIFFYIVFFCIELALFLNPIISHQPDRLTNLNFVVYAQVPLFVISLYVIFFKPKPSCLKILLLLFILSSIWGLSLFGTFDAPNIFRTNVALTDNEVHGMKWFFESRTSKNIMLPISSSSRGWRFHDLFADERGDSNFYIPYHFGYLTDNRSFTEKYLTFSDRSYIVLMTIDELLYQKVPGYMEVGRYTAEEFRRFRNEPSINKIYDSTNIEIYYYE